MRWYTGLPNKDGIYYIASPMKDTARHHDTDYIEYMDINTLNYTVEGGWNTFYDYKGVLHRSNYHTHGNEVWAEVMPPRNKWFEEWHERLQDILDEVDEFRKEDPARDDRDYESESECDYYNNLDELSDLLDQAIGFAREVA